MFRSTAAVVVCVIGAAALALAAALPRVSAQSNGAATTTTFYQDVEPILQQHNSAGHAHNHRSATSKHSTVHDI